MNHRLSVDERELDWGGGGDSLLIVTCESLSLIKEFESDTSPSIS